MWDEPNNPTTKNSKASQFKKMSRVTCTKRKLQVISMGPYDYAICNKAKMICAI